MTCGIRSPILERNLTRTEFNAAKTPQQKTAALSAARAAMNRYPLSGMMTSNYVDILYSLGRHEELINFLRNGTALSEGSSTYHALLARSYEALGKNLSNICILARCMHNAVKRKPRSTSTILLRRPTTAISM